MQKQKNNVMELTLCQSCASDFRDSGYFVIQKGWRQDKETCDFCHIRMGRLYGIFGSAKSNQHSKPDSNID